MFYSSLKFGRKRVLAAVPTPDDECCKKPSHESLAICGSGVEVAASKRRSIQSISTEPDSSRTKYALEDPSCLFEPEHATTILAVDNSACKSGCQDRVPDTASLECQLDDAEQSVFKCFSRSQGEESRSRAGSSSGGRRRLLAPKSSRQFTVDLEGTLHVSTFLDILQFYAQKPAK